MFFTIQVPSLFLCLHPFSVFYDNLFYVVLSREL